MDTGAAAMRDAEAAAERTFREHRHDAGWLDAFVAGLDRRRAVDSFRRTTETWGLSQAEAARLFGVSRQAIGKWRRRGVPAEARRGGGGSGGRHRSARPLSQARPYSGGGAAADSGTRRRVPGGTAGAGRYRRGARCVPRHVPIRPRAGLTVELASRAVAGQPRLVAHRRSGLGGIRSIPGFAQRPRRTLEPARQLSGALPERGPGDGAPEPARFHRPPGRNEPDGLARRPRTDAGRLYPAAPPGCLRRALGGRPSCGRFTRQLSARQERRHGSAQPLSARSARGPGPPACAGGSAPARRSRGMATAASWPGSRRRLGVSPGGVRTLAYGTWFRGVDSTA